MSAIIGMVANILKAKSPAEARFTSPTENCYITNKSQESTCQTMLRNECCTGYWLAGCLISPPCSIMLGINCGLGTRQYKNQKRKTRHESNETNTSPCGAVGCGGRVQDATASAAAFRRGQACRQDWGPGNRQVRVEGCGGILLGGLVLGMICRRG